MNITILNVVISTQPAKKPGGKPYQLAEVAFKNNTFGGKVEGKKITSYSKSWNAVAEAKPGETYDVGTEKNGEFVEWVSLQKASAQAATSVSPVVQQGQVPKSFSSPAPRSTYETSEERAVKQVYIIRQSSIANAVSALSVGAKVVKPEDVIALAKRFEEYVLSSGKLEKSSGGFDDVPDLDPSFDNHEPNIE